MPNDFLQVNFIVKLYLEYFSFRDKGNSSLYAGEPKSWNT